MIKDACDRKWIIIVLAAVLTAIVGASVQPVQARTDENWVTPGDNQRGRGSHLWAEERRHTRLLGGQYL